jgi:hypothetical protein
MRKIILGIIASVSLLVVLSGSASAAWNPFGDACSGAGGDSVACQDAKNQTGDPKSDPLTGRDSLLMKVTNIVAVIAGIAAVIIIILAGMRMVTSGGSSEDIAGARRSLIYAIVGLVVIALARVIIGLVLGML